MKEPELKPRDVALIVWVVLAVTTVVFSLYMEYRGRRPSAPVLEVRSVKF